MIHLDYLYNEQNVKKIFDDNYSVDKKLGFSVIDRGTVLTHEVPSKGFSWGRAGIINSNGEFIKSSFVHCCVGNGYTPSESIQHSSETVIYMGMFYYVWGHSITDNIRRLWFLESEDFKNQFKDCPLVYVSWRGRALEKQESFLRLLKILEVDVDRLREIKQPTQFEKIILPDESFWTASSEINSTAEYAMRNKDNWTRRFTNEYRETIDRVRYFALKNRTPTSSKKIYYFYGRRQFGEERLTEYFKSKGYEIVRPEKLTLDEQLNILINAESFVSTLGSISHNSLFLRDGTEAIFIPRFNGFTGHQRAIDQVHPLNIYYVDTSFSIFNSNHNSFCYVIGEQLKRFFGDKWDGYEEDDFKTFLQHVKYSVEEEGRKVNPNEIRDYGSSFQDFISQLRRRKKLIAAHNVSFDFNKLRPLLSYQTHVHRDGWVSWANENQISNDIEQKFDIQAIKVNFPSYKVCYAVYYSEQEGWSEEIASPEQAGTVGEHKPIKGIRIRLDEAGSKEFDILYRVHNFDGQWSSWAKNGEALYSYGVKLNAIQIKLKSKSDT